MEENQKQTKENEYYKVLKPLRTYERDLAEHVRDTNASKTEINLKEQVRKQERKVEKKEKPEKVPNNKSKNLIAIILVVLILVSVSGLIFSVFGSGEKKESAPEPEIVMTKSFINADKSKNLDIKNLNLESLAKSVEDSASEEEVGLKKVVLLNLLDGQSNPKKEISSEIFLKTIEVKPPLSFLRALGENMDLGIYSLEKHSPFLIFEVKDFGNAYAGMLQWENKAPSEMIGWISNDIPGKITFSDLSSGGKDLRILRNSKGEIVFLYSFLDKNKLLISDRLDTFKEVLTKLK